MRSARVYHILSLVLACCGTAAWVTMQDHYGYPLRGNPGVLWLLAAMTGFFAWRIARRDRAAFVRQLRQATSSIGPNDASIRQSSQDADAIGAALDGLIAAARALDITSKNRIHELEIALKAVTLDRDDAAALLANVEYEIGQSQQAVNPPANATPISSLFATGGCVSSEESRRFHTSFLGRVSHAIRTPLATIRACSEMLIDGEAADGRSLREFYEIIHSEADRLSRSIDNVMTLSRLEGGLVEPSRRVVSLDDAVNEAADGARLRLRAKELTLDLQLASGATVEGDLYLLQQAVANLLDNAIKFTPNGGRILIHLAKACDDRKVHFWIEDSGVGVDPKDHPGLFDKQGTAHHQTGIGLKLTARIIEEIHRGRMRVEPRPGTGGGFGFELDCVEARSTANEGRSHE